MSDAPRATESIFLSYSRVDQAKVRSLARELRSAGVVVSYDAVENLRLGDDLAVRLREAVDRHDYLGVVLSASSAESQWVARELAWALEKEVALDRTMVLPIVIEPCQLPSSLVDRVRIDFSVPEARAENMLALVSRLGGDRLDSIKLLYPLVASLMYEVDTDSTMEATVDAVFYARIPGPVLEAAVRNLIPRASPNGLLGLAKLSIRTADETTDLYELSEDIISDPRFPDYGIPTLAALGATLSDDTIADWWHDSFIRYVHDDAYYNTLVQAHAVTLAGRCYDAVASYLLHPNRGPSNYNVDSFLAIMLATDRPYPFARRWSEWIIGGGFDSYDQVSGNEDPSILYACLNDGIEAGSSEVRELAEQAIDYVKGLLRSDRSEPARAHLRAMLDREFLLAHMVNTRILDHYDGSALDEGPVRAAFHHLALVQTGKESAKSKEFDAVMSAATHSLR